MVTWTLVLVIVFQVQPRAITHIDGYTAKEQCEYAAQAVSVAQRSAKYEITAWCIPGPQR
jgi:hypothetical protein